MSVSKKPSAFESIVAGGAAGGAEALVTYPTEYVKTRQQLSRNAGMSSSPLTVLINTLRHGGIRPIYTGAGVFGLSNASKSAVRFATFDVVRQKLPKDPITGKPLAVSNMFAGLCAGVAESVTVLTPGENIKTKLIDGRAGQATNGYSSTGQTLSRILASEGIAGLYCGVVPVAMKQSANAVVRFTTYQLLLERISAHSGLSPISPALAGGMAGIVTVYATMPFDNIKTKLQAIGGAEAYSGTFNCLKTIFRCDGVNGLWRGTTPRLVRLSVSGVLSFSIYEQVIASMKRIRIEDGFSKAQESL